MTEQVIVTAALPYANGNAHLGHLVEYCQADIYVRALKRMGAEALYVCASDAHGTPIEVNATRLGVPPEQLIQQFHSDFQRDFARFDIAFDHYGITHSPTNRETVERVYTKLRQGGHLDDREVDGNWCEHDQRFLPDRFIKGTCPKCGAADQYGDVCETCGATYAATDLDAPRCILCGSPPSRKKSTHVFFKLSAPEHVSFLRQWIDSGALQSDVANYVRNWVDGGLRDWCISRDGPYFGFPIPDRPGKFFYVWLDAPLGYVSSSVDWGRQNGRSLEDLWCSDTFRIEHIIGKDIVYFHTLFWPAVLHAVGMTLPTRVRVHGMLTVNGEKMSKSRGTFINADVFAQHVDPQALRFYYATKLGPNSDDIDLSFDDFVLRVNADLVNKHANLFSRTAQFVQQKLDGKLGDLPFSPEAAQEPAGEMSSMLELARRIVSRCRRVEALYRRLEFGQVMRELAAVADIGNEFMQSEQPWVQLKTDPERARTTCTFAANVCHALAMYLWPVVPRFAEAGARVLGVAIDRMDAGILFGLRDHSLGTFERLFDRVETTSIQAMLESSRETLNPTRVVPPSTTGPELTQPLINFDQFRALDLRVGVIKQVESIPKSKKLLKLKVDLGEPQLRQVVAGIAQAYPVEHLLERRVIVVANLKAAKLMGVESQGMILAAGQGSDLTVLGVERPVPPGTRVS